MGKSKGDAARSKNRPSSSSLAASLVPSGALSVGGFGGYVGTSRLADSTNIVASAAHFLDVDGEVAQHLKRLSRKDPTTKLKALASLSELFKQKNKEEIVQVIPQWAFEYKRLLQDYNRDVRRATQDTMNNLVITAGRGLAPYLKSLLGPWWFSQFDPVSEVSQSARRSLQDAFPAQEKRLDALILCTNDVFVYLEENLKLTPETMSDKSAPLDELEEMHIRVSSSSLLALATLVDILFGMQVQKLGFDNVTSEPKHASKARESAKSSVERIFSAHQYFLEFLKSKSPAVRSAAYSVLGSLIKYMPHLFDEKNMKTVSASILGAFQEKDPTCHPSMWDMILLFSKSFPETWSLNNIQKTVLNRFWIFLRNGCYGSQQVSYPVLVVFLDVIPPKAIDGNQFFLSFFQNLWQGRNPSHSLRPERLAFFKAFKECFLWFIHNASRYAVDGVSHFRVSLFDSIIVNLLWCDYLMLASSKDRGGVSQERTVENLNTKYSSEYMQDLGKCIIEVLSDISLKECDLIATFMQKGETWPLQFLVVPMITKVFPSIRSLDNPDAVKLLSITVSIFGPRYIISPLSACKEGDASSPQYDDQDYTLKSDSFLSVFKEVFVPWCLHENNHSTSARLDLLLALLDNEFFSEQWSSILLHVTSLGEFQKSDFGSSDFDHISVLALLMEKVKEIVRIKMQVGNNSQQSFLVEYWHHKLLDSTAVSIASSCSPLPMSYSRFLRAVLGGSEGDDQISFVSSHSMILIFKELLKKIVPLLDVSSYSWAKDAYSLILSTALKGTDQKVLHVDVLELAKFALEVLEGSIYCLKKMDEEPELVPCISALIFITDWLYRMTSVVTVNMSSKISENIMDFELHNDSRLFKSIHALRFKISSQFWKSLSIISRSRLETILIQTIRSVIFGRGALDADEASLCCQLVLEVLDSFCLDQCEEQILLDKLLDRADLWPLWIELSPSGDAKPANPKFASLVMDIQISRNHNFVAFVSELISKLGVSRIIAGSQTTSPSSLETHGPLATEHSFSRAWIAVEILCTWKWSVGGVLDSFLPLLSEFANGGEVLSEYLLDSIVDILLDGALGCVSSDELCFLNVWLASDDEIENIQEPFLRALVSLLSTLIVKDNIWGKNKSAVLFDHLVDRLFSGVTVNRTCLRILPYVINILVQSLRHNGTISAKNDSYKENQMQVIVSDWLPRALLLPPIISWLPDQDYEEWIEVIISCYPLDARGGISTLNTVSESDISDSEKSLLVELYRKQRTENNTLAGVNQYAQTTLSKLTSVAVGYCWKEFNEEDWDFLLSLVKRWIESVVVVIEEIAEHVDEIISESCGDLEMDIEKLDRVVEIRNQSLVNIAQNALFTLSIITGLIESQNDHLESLLGAEKLKDEILSSVVRIFFATGVSEAIAGVSSPEASSIVASSRYLHPHFWELVASTVVSSPQHVRHSAVQSMELWELKRGAISSLYAILFSSIPISKLQYAAYITLSTGPISQLSIIKDENHLSLEEEEEETSMNFREEISGHIKRSPSEKIVEMEEDLLSLDRVNMFISWALLLSHLQSLPLTSPEKQRLIQCIQDSANSKILDCIFQHIPLKKTGNLKKDVDIPLEVSLASKAAENAITTGCLSFCVESVWPVKIETMASLAGGLYGLMLRVLPAYVRDWFNSVRDRSSSAAIEYFTKKWCSPCLLADELSQIKKDSVVDENFSISVSKSSCEVVATYKKEETGMDLVISLPPSYPLRPVDVDCTRSLGISEQKQRKWLMSMIAFVRSQNGALAEAIRRWKSNFDKEFQGVEDCPICYSIIHTANNTLPRLACKTCKYKFHSACLYKWFSTSHKSNCPLCQSPFQSR
ncbi:RING-type E3 ubiquitin transferase [Ranunculus cassubicifolius]